MKTPELLPCPFCGGEAGYYVSGNKGYVYCKGCGAMSDGSYTNRDPDWKQEEARLWNQRVYPPEVQEAIEKQKPKEPTDVICICECLVGVCSACGATVNTGNRFCRICGQKQDWSSRI